MPTPGQELATIDFESMLGGPLVAVIHAQAQSSIDLETLPQMHEILRKYINS